MGVVVNGVYWAYEPCLGWHDPKELLPYMIDLETRGELQAELYDREFRGRTHGHHKTYEAGCRGPLCSDANKFRSREKHRARAEAAGRPLAQRSATHVVPPQIRSDQSIDDYKKELEAWIEDRKPKSAAERRKAREEANLRYNQAFSRRWSEQRAAATS